jgi:nitroreductase
MAISLYNIKIKFQNSVLLPIVRRHRKLADLYYFLFSSDFSREHQKVLNGKYIHLSALQDKRPNAFHLRRQVHRLEKGLTMKNRREVFGLDYIFNTSDNYRILSNSAENDSEIDEGLLLWSASVLKTYFNVVKEVPEVTRAKKVFESVQHKIGVKEVPTDFIPYKRSAGAKAGIQFEDFYTLTKQRRSVRWYLDKPVPRELINKACLAATQSPSACNRQPFEFRIFDEPELKNKIGSIPMGIQQNYKNIPVFVVVIGRLSAYMSERDRHVIYIDGGLASMSFMLALETLGLSSVPINWPDIEYQEKKMESLIPMAADERPIMMIGLGYADPEGGIPFSQKKSPAQLLIFNNKL